MKKLAISFVLAAGLAAFVGCEGWQFGGGADSFNESGGWGDVSGLYVGSSGSYLVSSYSNLAPATSNLQNVTVFTTEAGRMFYSGVLDLNGAVVAGSISGFIGDSATFSVDADGAISGGITGTLNLNTGAYSMTLAAASANEAVKLVYQTTSGGGNISGGSSVITSFTVEQSGNKLKITDNNGSIYQGTMGLTSTNHIGDTNMTALSASFSFEAHGVSAAGFNVEMVGVFQASGELSGDVLSTNTEIVTISTAMDGTWLEEGGKTGHIHGIRQ